MFFTYILFSKSLNKYYCGSTDNLERRLQQHNSGYSKSTKGGVPWELEHFEEFTDRTNAVQRENEIKKKKSRKYIEAIISKGERPE